MKDLNNEIEIEIIEAPKEYTNGKVLDVEYWDADKKRQPKNKFLEFIENLFK